MMHRARRWLGIEPLMSIQAYREVSGIADLVEVRLGEREALLLRHAADARIFGDPDADRRCEEAGRWYDTVIEHGDEELADGAASLTALLATISPVAGAAERGDDVSSGGRADHGRFVARPVV